MVDVRTGLILLGSAGCAALAGALRLASGVSWPDALLAAGATFGFAVGVLVLLVKRDQTPDGS